MLARERRKLGKLVKEFALANGGEESAYSLPGLPVYDIRTTAGMLHVGVDVRSWGTIFCRFEDIEAAKKAVGGGICNRLNPLSGKWNFHFGRISAAGAFAEWTTALEPLLVRCP